MRAFLDVTFASYGISRVALQLAKYMPEDIQIATDPDSADLTVLHINGRRDHTKKWAGKIKAAGHRYAMIQYVLESCRNPKPADWKELWDGATAVWSYYDLREHIPNLYYAPLAADTEKFYPMPEVEKKYLVGTNGNTFVDECHGEVRLAAFGVGGKVVHTGPNDGADPNVTVMQNISDDDMRMMYNQCKYFSALRRKDGFEIVAIEALLCGVRPIMFDAPRYRKWFDGLAVFIPEGTVGEVTREVRGVLRKEPAPVTEADIATVKERFNWETLIRGFWQRCLER